MGVRNLAILAATSVHNAFVLFVSSVASVGEWKGSSQVPEAPINDLTAAANMGYGQSKLIAENLLNKASEISGVRSAICRVGIVAGPVEQELGMWNKHEYIPSVSTCLICIDISTNIFEDHSFIGPPWLLSRNLPFTGSYRLATGR